MLDIEQAVRDIHLEVLKLTKGHLFLKDRMMVLEDTVAFLRSQLAEKNKKDY